MRQADLFAGWKLWSCEKPAPSDLIVMARVVAPHRRAAEEAELIYRVGFGADMLKAAAHHSHFDADYKAAAFVLLDVPPFSIDMMRDSAVGVRSHQGMRK